MILAQHGDAKETSRCLLLSQVAALSHCQCMKVCCCLHAAMTPHLQRQESSSRKRTAWTDPVVPLIRYIVLACDDEGMNEGHLHLQDRERELQGDNRNLRRLMERAQDEAAQMRAAYADMQAQVWNLASADEHLGSSI